MSKPRYILQKPTPNLSPGAIFKWAENSGVYIEITGVMAYPRKTVEDNPDWFLPEQPENMQNEKWQWTDELVKEFTDNCMKAGAWYGDTMHDLKLFKQSKQPLKPDTKERIEVVTEDNEKWVKLPLDAFNEAIQKAKKDAWNFAREKMIIDGKPTERQYRFLSFYDYENYEKTNETLYQQSLQTKTSKHWT